MIWILKAVSRQILAQGKPHKYTETLNTIIERCGEPISSSQRSIIVFLSPPHICLITSFPSGGSKAEYFLSFLFFERMKKIASNVK